MPTRKIEPGSKITIEVEADALWDGDFTFRISSRRKRGSHPGMSRIDGRFTIVLIWFSAGGIEPPTSRL